MFNDSLFMSLSQNCRDTLNLLSQFLGKAIWNFVEVLLPKTHEIPKNQISVAESLMEDIYHKCQRLFAKNWYKRTDVNVLPQTIPFTKCLSLTCGCFKRPFHQRRHFILCYGKCFLSLCDLPTQFLTHALFCLSLCFAKRHPCYSKLYFRIWNWLNRLYKKNFF